jgi:hypothetical protein
VCKVFFGHARDSSPRAVVLADLDDAAGPHRKRAQHAEITRQAPRSRCCRQHCPAPVHVPAYATSGQAMSQAGTPNHRTCRERNSREIGVAYGAHSLTIRPRGDSREGTRYTPGENGGVERKVVGSRCRARSVVERLTKGALNHGEEDSVAGQREFFAF